MEISVVILERTDDLASVLDRLEWAKTNRVALVWPDRGTPIECRLHLVRVLRKAESLGGTIALVTKQSSVTGWAGELGIPVFDELDSALSSYWRPSRRRKSIRQKGQVTYQRLAPIKKVKRVTSVQSRGVGGWLSIILSLAALLLVVMFLLPSSEIVVSPRTVEQSLVIAIQSRTDLSAPTISGGLPVEAISVMVQGEADGRSSGTTAIPEIPARGYVEFQNITDQVVEVPAGTILVSSTISNARYITLEDLSLPPKNGEGYFVEIEAVSPGILGNLDTGMINAIEGQIGLVAVVRNPDPVIGGIDSQAPSPTEEDYTMLRDSLMADLLEQVKVEVNGRIDSDQILIPDLVIIKNIIEQRFPKVAEPSDQTRLVLSAEIVMYAYRSVDLESVARMALDATIPVDHEPSNEPIELTMISEPVIDGESASWQIYSLRSIWRLYDMIEITQHITGQTIREAEQIISAEMELENDPVIRVYPAVWSRLPFFSPRILWVLE